MNFDLLDFFGLLFSRAQLLLNSVINGRVTVGLEMIRLAHERLDELEEELSEDQDG